MEEAGGILSPVDSQALIDFAFGQDAGGASASQQPASEQPSSALNANGGPLEGTSNAAGGPPSMQAQPASPQTEQRQQRSVSGS